MKMLYSTYNIWSRLFEQRQSVRLESLNKFSSLHDSTLSSSADALPSGRSARRTVSFCMAHAGCTDRGVEQQLSGPFLRGVEPESDDRIRIASARSECSLRTRSIFGRRLTGRHVRTGERGCSDTLRRVQSMECPLPTGIGLESRPGVGAANGHDRVQSRRVVVSTARALATRTVYPSEIESGIVRATIPESGNEWQYIEPLRSLRS